MNKIRSYSTSADGLKVVDCTTGQDVSGDYVPLCNDAPAVKRVTATALVFDTDDGQRRFDVSATEQTADAINGVRALLESIWGDRIKGVI